MAQNKKVNSKTSNLQDALKGCYGSHIKPSEAKRWLIENIFDNINRKKRITLNINGAPGCVFKDTMIVVKKISDDNGHQIFVK